PDCDQRLLHAARDGDERGAHALTLTLSRKREREPPLGSLALLPLPPAGEGWGEGLAPARSINPIRHPARGSTQPSPGTARHALAPPGAGSRARCDARPAPRAG